MDRRLFRLCVAILLWAASISAQSRIDERGVYHPSDEELAANKRMIEVLRHPTLITLRLVSVPHDISKEQPTATPPPYRLGNWIHFQLLISQTFSEPLVIRQALDPYYDVRPQLFRDGDLFPYSKEAQEHVDRKENAPSVGSGAESRLLPGREYGSYVVRLESWYKPLGPGHYQLTVRRRFAWGGEWLQSSPVTFDILAETVNAVESKR